MTDTSTTHRILIADDHGLMRGGLALLLKTTELPIEVHEANSLEAAWDVLSETPDFDLVLLDLIMPGMNGTEGLRKIVAQWPDAPVIVVSVKDDAEAIRQALKLGALGFIPKASSPDVMIGAIRLVLAGGIYIPPAALAADTGGEGTDTDRPGPQRGTAAGEFGLTDRQVEVIELMAQGMPNHAIAERLGLQVGTVKMHVSRIFRVMGTSNRTEAVSRFLARQ